MKYDWEAEVKEVKKYSHRSVSELSDLYRKYPKNLNIKFAYMQRLYCGDDVDKMDEEEAYRARRYHDYNEDQPKALKLLDELLMMNHGSSMVFSANGYVIKRPLEERVEILNKAIDLGFLPALDDLAHMYSKNKDEEINVHKRGMELGYPKSYIDMAYFLEDKEKKEEYINYAANILNSGLAQYVKARNYDIYENYNESFKYYLKASLNGNSDAMIHLGQLYEKGLGCKKDIHEAIKWYKESIEYGEAYGAHYLAMIYLNNGKEKEGFRLLYDNQWLTPLSKLELGRCFRDGKGCQVNKRAAFECFKYVVNSTFYEYAYDLVDCYYNGIGVDIDYEMAYEYLEYYDPIESDEAEKFKKLKDEIEAKRCPHCGEFDTKVIENGYEVCSSCKGKWNEMKLYSEEKLVFDELDIDGIRFIPLNTNSIGNPRSVKYLRYISKDNTDNYDNCDYVLAYIKDEYVGLFIGESIKNPTVKAYAGKDEPIYSVRSISAKDEEVLKVMLKYIEKLVRARGEGYLDFNIEDKEYEEFYDFLRNYNKASEMDKYIFSYDGYKLKCVKDGDLEIRETYNGEEYDIGKGSPLKMEDGETNLAYIESDSIRYTYGMVYVVCYDNSKSDYLGYSIGEVIRVTDTKTYNCYFIKDMFIFEDTNFKYEVTNKIFNYLIDLCTYMSCEYIKIKVVENNFYSYFYQYCKNNLNMEEKEGYLIKKVC